MLTLVDVDTFNSQAVGNKDKFLAMFDSNIGRTILLLRRPFSASSMDEANKIPLVKAFGFMQSYLNTTGGGVLQLITRPMVPGASSAASSWIIQKDDKYYVYDTIFVTTGTGNITNDFSLHSGLYMFWETV